ncbi:DUF4097 family beta strand repeat-containing protein [Streptomyces sp. NPDC049954]|uniref:DUF4097 family beta strand repeat-containing protein n=1 Tax=Streptomyces sp. NPDC049954 TaxID=3155779 RepID=UPI00341D12A0
MAQWSVTEPRKLTFGEPVETVRVRIVGGAVNIVGADALDGPEGEAARLHVSEIEGPPLIVEHEGSTLTVTYEDLQWKNLLKWLDRRTRQRRRAVVSLVVPAGAHVEVGVVTASATVSGVRGGAAVKAVTGDTTLARTEGEVSAETVSGSIEVQSVTGPLRFASVSGGLTLVDGGGPSVRAESVSGDMILDLDPGGAPTDIKLTSVSGEIAIRLPHPADAEVEVNTTSGSLSNAFEDLRVSGMWGSKRITGRLGSGAGSLKATTVSGSLALLRRPSPRTGPADTPGPTDTTDPTDPTDKKVL